MNPWAFIAIAIGVIVIIIGIKGTQHHVASALTGKASQSGQSATQQSGSNKPILA